MFQSNAWLTPTGWCLIWIGLTVTGSVQAASASDAPRILLVQATLTGAKALAVEAATRKGWRLHEEDQHYCLFETRLPSEALGEPASRLRIRADFEPILPGVRVSLRAAQVFHLGRPNQRVEVVTQKYRANLDNALASLRHKWRPQTLERQRPTAQRLSGSGDQGARSHSGMWRYYAQQRASSLGCDYAEGDVVLIDQDSSGESYRVRCFNRESIALHCSDGDCRML
jgi:hypothetical protein